MQAPFYCKSLIAIIAGILLLSAQASGRDFAPRDIYAKAAPAVVFIFAGNEAGTGSAGTGSIILPDGKVLTNCHVVTDSETRKPYPRIVVCLKPEHISGDSRQDLANSYKAVIVDMDAQLDLAVLKVEGIAAVLPVIELGDSGAVATGDPVAAIGHPEGGGLWILTTGTISGVKKMGVQDVFQTEASINRGNSGGPLLDEQGRLVGVNTSMSRKAADGIAIVGVNFAVKSSQVKSWLDTKGIRVSSASGPKAKPKEAREAPPEKPVQPSPEPGKDLKAGKAPPRPEKPSSDALKPDTPQTAPPVAEKPGPECLPQSDELKEFRGPGGELMYGLPDSGFTLDKTIRAVFARARDNAGKAFQELEEIERK